MYILTINIYHKASTACKYLFKLKSNLKLVQMTFVLQGEMK